MAGDTKRALADAARRRLLVETFPRGQRHYLVCYPFEGRLAHQTLGMLLTRRMERAGLHPLGLCRQRLCADCLVHQRCRARIDNGLVSLDDLFAQDMLGDDLEDWLQESALMKRTFRNLRDHRGHDRAALPREEENGATGDNLDRSYL